MIRLRRLAVLLVCLTILLGFAPLRPGQPVSTAAQALGARIWVGRYQEIEEYLRTAECVNMQMLGPSAGVMRCTLRPGGLVARMAWRSGPPGIYRGFWESYKAEIAAYELDKLLKMNMLPPAVEREFQGNKGSGTLWVENIVDSKAASPDEANRAGWEKQLVQMTMFDNLIGNSERNTRNMLRDGAWNLILLEHKRAFRPGADLPNRLSRIDADLWDKVQALTRTQLDARLGPWLDENEIAAIIDRRERMKAEIDRLLAEKGAGAVFLR
jgi:hypothetical protein